MAAAAAGRGDVTSDIVGGGGGGESAYLFRVVGPQVEIPLIRVGDGDEVHEVPGDQFRRKKLY